MLGLRLRLWLGIGPRLWLGWLGIRLGLESVALGSVVGLGRLFALLLQSVVGPLRLPFSGRQLQRDVSAALFLRFGAD